MGDNPGPPDQNLNLDRPPDPVMPPPGTSNPDQPTLTYAAALGGVSGGKSNLLKYEEIIVQQKTQRNVLEMKIKKVITKDNDGEIIQPKSLTIDDLSEFVFEILNVQFDECVGVDFFTGRYDTREILLKPQVDTSKYITKEPLVYKQHEITIKKMLNGATKVTFKNVPMYVPDEEILHLCGIYGTVQDNKVYWEKFRVTTSKQKGVLLSPTRYVLMNLNNGAMFNNFYWMEGPMPGDPGRRVTVLHHGQKQQCSNCFLTASSGCKGAGNGRACAAANVERAKMSSYMEALKISTGYESLKSKYLRRLSRNYPDLQGEPQQLNTTLKGDMDRDLDDEDEENEITEGIVPINPIIEKDREIAELQKKIENLNAKVAEIDILEKKLEEATTENRRVLTVSRQVGRRLSVSRQANEQKLVSLLQTGANWTEDSAHLACCLSASINEDEFEIDEATDTVRAKNRNFNLLKKVEEHLDPSDKIQQERLDEMRRMILERIKKTIKKKMDTRGEKRASENQQMDKNAFPKPRVISPEK